MYSIKMSFVIMHSRLFPILSCNRFSVSGLLLKSLIHLDLSFVQGGMFGSICISSTAHIPFDQHHLLRKLSIFFPVRMSGFFIKTQVAIGVWL